MPHFVHVLVLFSVSYRIKDRKEEGHSAVSNIKTSGSELRGQEEAASMRIFRPMRPLQ